jgi:pyruvate dehydrogenase E2 component (dihydrolipoamide acetyltransferase)/2-oxoglutarate dehydrogenase E2 component (dihydrolipoamide succinyltransferase)
MKSKKLKEVIPLRGVRKAIAEHVQRSVRVAVHATDGGAFDMTEMIKFRQHLNAKEKETGIHFTYTDLFVKVVAEALKQHPLLNSSLVDNEIRIWEDINIGITLAYEAREGGSALIVPVVHNADKKTLVQIHNTLTDLVNRGKNRRLLPDDVTGGTFTLNNLNLPEAQKVMDASSWSTQILNEPEVAILLTMPIADAPVVRGGQIVVRPMMNYSLTYDERVLTGADDLRFLGTLQDLINQPNQLELSSP